MRAAGILRRPQPLGQQPAERHCLALAITAQDYTVGQDLDTIRQRQAEEAIAAAAAAAGKARPGNSSSGSR